MESNYSVKLFVNDEVRRFVFSGVSFEELKKKCVKLANIPEGTTVALKYEDPEGDKISISSDIELDYALSISTNQLLRLHMTTVKIPTPASPSQQPQTSAQPPPSNLPVDTHMNWRAQKEAQKIARHEWKQHKKVMKGRGMVHPHPNGPPVLPTFDPSAKPFVPQPHHHIHGPMFLHAPYPLHQGNPYVSPHGYSPVSHYFQAMPAETLSEPLPYGGKKVKELDARFIMHQSYPDDTEVPAGSKFEKTWRFRNTGILKWPEGTVFLRVDRANELLAPDTTPVASIDPNQETDVTVQMTSPASPGRYQSYFKLCSPTGKKFGQRMRCQILSVSGSSISPEQIDKVWELLEAMGFVETGQRPNTISSLILRENCDVARIVRELRKQK